jgi:tRNA(Ile)-lysidine synthase
MLQDKILSKLRDKKNLLAFSGGADSSALFFLLTQESIPFDIAIVNYGIREQSRDEVAYAKELSAANNITCHIYNAPKIEQNFEAKAREIRYEFFSKLSLENSYENLLTAHHLGDRFEWFLMQFCKGAGCAEIAGMQSVQKRGSYTIIRPLLHLEKRELIEYLHRIKARYFEDESNLDESIKRNYFRHNHTTPLLERHLEGIRKSFAYLDEDREALIEEADIKVIDKFAYFKRLNTQRSNIFAIDKYLKSQLYMLSANERDLLREQKSLVVGRKFVINQSRKFVFIAPYITKVVMSSEFKEECRVLKIEPKLRNYLYENREVFLKIKELF